MLDGTEADRIREEQKQLNLRRKAARKITSLETQVQEEAERYERWKEGMMKMMSNEEIPYHEKMRRLRADLTHAKNEQDDDMEAGMEKEDEVQETTREVLEENSRLQRQLEVAAQQQDELLKTGRICTTRCS